MAEWTEGVLETGPVTEDEAAKGYVAYATLDGRRILLSPQAATESGRTLLQCVRQAIGRAAHAQPAARDENAPTSGTITTASVPPRRGDG